jgi:hypothetical protein
MNDIVERLREGVFGTDETKTDAVIHSHMQAAADEIERLRAECQRLAGEVSRAHKDALGWMQKAAAARREGIEGAAKVSADAKRQWLMQSQRQPHQLPAAQAAAAIEAEIRALLEDK